MNYRLYIDVFWITLSVVDLTAMIGMVYMLKHQLRIRRCVGLALLSAGTEVMIYLIAPYYWLYRMLILCVINPLLVVGLLFPSKRADYLKGYLLITGLLLVIGGGQTLFLYGFPVKNSIWIWQMLLATFCVFMCLRAKNSNKQTQHECQVELKVAEKVISLRAYHDTGNFLRDPFTGKPVSIIEESIVESFLTERKNIRFIPYQTVGEMNGLLEVFTIEEMKITQNEKVLWIKQPVIGLSKNRLFLKPGIHMILHSELL